MGNYNCEVQSMEYSDIYVKRIRSLCKQRGIAINKLATMSGVNQSTLDNIVRGITKDPMQKIIFIHYLLSPLFKILQLL